MTPKSKTPTASGISRLLAAAGFTRAIPLLRGGVSGFGVSGLGADVEVRYSSVTIGTSNERRYAELARYAKVLELHGYAVRTDPSLPRLIVTTKTEEA